uniref:Tubulin polyglutamylase TTLL11 n=1 Tax=Bursaphelenchus xylophilus TaxID=6326 RepID=A0A1I7RSU1_BURXY
MGCQQSACQIKPGDVYDEKSIGALPQSSPLEVEIESEKSKSEALNIKRPERFEIPAGRKLFRPATSDSAYSETSVDSGMGSADTSLLFKPLPTSNEEFSIDTSLAKSNTQVVSMCAKKLNIKEYPEGRPDGKPCSMYWHSQVHNDMKSFIKSSDSKVNKFPGMTDLARKIALTQAIRSMRELFPQEYNFYPQSWILPSQYNNFRNYSSRNPNKWFIVKPDEGAQGIGIYLINHPEQLHSIKERLLVQEYLDEPYLLPDKLKFDFRVYAVIKSINPLSIYVAREGMARFCTEKYQKPTQGNFTHLYSHLTNYSLNKSNNAYIHSSNLKDQLTGSKRLLSTVFHQMESNGLRTRKLWHDVKLIIVKTVLAMVPEIMLNYEHYFSDVTGPQCFQIMGFDIIVDKNGDPLLLEVNSAPSLVIDHHLSDETTPVRSIVDEMIKVPLVRDTILLVLNQLNVTEKESNLDKLNNNCEDDINVQKKRRKPHLSEVSSQKISVILQGRYFYGVQLLERHISKNPTN